MGNNGISEYGNMPFSYKIPEIPAVDYEKVNSAQDAVKAPKAAEVKPQDIALSIEKKTVMFQNRLPTCRICLFPLIYRKITAIWERIAI